MKVSWHLPPEGKRNTLLRAQVCALWAAGLTLGLLADRFYGVTLDACVLLSVGRSLRPEGLVPVVVLPLLISAFAVLIFPPLLHGLALARGFLLGATMGSIATVYGDAGILVTGLLLFSTLAFSPVLMWYWFQPRSCNPRRLGGRTLACFLIGLMIWAGDRWLISIFLAEIMTF